MSANNQQQPELMPLEKLTRPNIRKLSPYSSDRNDTEASGLIYLDANESPTGACNRYPDGMQTRLKAQIGKMKSWPEDQVFIGNGSDEIIDLCFRIFCRPGVDTAVTYGPTFSMYRVIAQLNDVAMEELPLDAGFQPNPVLLQPFRADETARLLLLCSPNNPTGNSFDGLEELVRNFRGITLIDEAYIDFSERPSFLEKLKAYPNVIICQTLSKAHALAGARVGIAFAAKEIIRLFNAARMPYNISTLNQAAALNSLNEEDKFRQRINTMLQERAKVIAALSVNPLVELIYPTDANFILIRVADADRFCRALRQKGILVRSQSSAMPGCVRISIGAPHENERLISVVNTLSKQPAA
jgi:histidinol-phosphate aminotransferase